jgi:methyl-accepting chemotaxis protein
MALLNLIKSIGHAVAEEQARLRWLIMSVVGGAIKFSETEVMAAVSNLTGIQHEARQHTGDLQEIVARRDREGEATRDAMGHQARFCQESSLRLRQQSDAAARALRLTDEISTTVRDIGKISNAVRVLTINGYIESTRLGGEGRVFAVIAEQLRELSDQVRAANEDIRDLAADLSELIPVIADNSRALLQLTEQFAEEHAEKLAACHGQHSTAQREICAAVQEARERAERIIQRASRALSHLQFQDRMAQNLRDIEEIAANTEQLFQEMFDRLNTESESGKPLDPYSALTEARRAVPQRSPGRLEPDVRGQDGAAGEVVKKAGIRANKAGEVLFLD